MSQTQCRAAQQARPGQARPDQPSLFTHLLFVCFEYCGSTGTRAVRVNEEVCGMAGARRRDRMAAAVAAAWLGSVQGQNYPHHRAHSLSVETMSASTGALLTSYCWSLQHRLTCIIDAHSLALAMAQSAGPHHTTAERISAHHARHTCSYTRGTLATEEATPSVPPLTLLPLAASAAPLTMAALSCPGHPQAARPQCQLCRRPVGQVEWIGLHATLALG